MTAAQPVKSPRELDRRDDQEWYERGLWPFFGTAVTLAITNGIAIWLVYLQSARAFNALLRQRKIEQLGASLSEFYDPLLAQLDVNHAIFQRTGPNSFPKHEPGLSAAALVWAETKKKILANNRQIEMILCAKTHLMDESDSLESYHDLLLHVAMYETFQAVETEMYKRFMFPAGARGHILAARNLVIARLAKAMGEQT